MKLLVCPWLLLLCWITGGQVTRFSCAMDGCNAARNGVVVGVPLPDTQPSVVWNYTAPGLTSRRWLLPGCSSDGELLACVLPTRKALVALDRSGNLQWADG